MKFRNNRRDWARVLIKYLNDFNDFIELLDLVDASRRSSFYLE